ncbi:MAG: glutamine--fructose-6-phosphate aminotransferase, partial [Candidatus Limnocylindria bacterium]
MGHGEGENFVASDIPALLEHTRQVTFLEQGELVVVTAGRVDIRGFNGEPRPRAAQTIAWDPISAAKAGYKHFMLKEIHEQPRAISDTLLG